MRALTLCMICFLCSPLCLFSETLTIDDVMTKDEQEQCKIDKMSDEQKQALEKWISSWTERVVRLAPTYAPALSYRQWIASWPLADNPQKAATPAQIAAQNKKINRRIDKVIGDGKTILLKDGSVWTIAEYDRYKTRRWYRNDELEWVPSGDAINPYKLRNITRRQFAIASMTEPPSPTGEIKPPPTSFYEGSIRVSSVNPLGTDVTLEDDSSWDIAPNDQIRVKEWKVNDRIIPSDNNDYLYRSKLANLDSGETVLANPR